MATLTPRQIRDALLKTSHLFMDFFYVQAMTHQKDPENFKKIAKIALDISEFRHEFLLALASFNYSQEQLDKPLDLESVSARKLIDAAENYRGKMQLGMKAVNDGFLNVPIDIYKLLNNASDRFSNYLAGNEDYSEIEKNTELSLIEELSKQMPEGAPNSHYVNLSQVNFITKAAHLLKSSFASEKNIVDKLDKHNLELLEKVARTLAKHLKTKNDANLLLGKQSMRFDEAAAYSQILNLLIAEEKEKQFSAMLHEETYSAWKEMSVAASVDLPKRNVKKAPSMIDFSAGDHLLTKLLANDLTLKDLKKIEEFINSPNDLYLRAVGLYAKEVWEKNNARKIELEIDELTHKETLIVDLPVEAIESHTFKKADKFIERIINGEFLEAGETNHLGVALNYHLKLDDLTKALNLGEGAGLGRGFINPELQKYYQAIGLIEIEKKPISKIDKLEAFETLFRIFNEGDESIGVNQNRAKAAIILALAASHPALNENKILNAELNAQFMARLARYYESFGQNELALQYYQLAFRNLKDNTFAMKIEDFLSKDEDSKKPSPRSKEKAEQEINQIKPRIEESSFNLQNSVARMYQKMIFDSETKKQSKYQEDAKAWIDKFLTTKMTIQMRLVRAKLNEINSQEYIDRVFISFAFALGQKQQTLNSGRVLSDRDNQALLELSFLTQQVLSSKNDEASKQLVVLLQQLDMLLKEPNLSTEKYESKLLEISEAAIGASILDIAWQISSVIEVSDSSEKQYLAIQQIAKISGLQGKTEEQIVCLIKLAMQDKHPDLALGAINQLADAHLVPKPTRTVWRNYQEALKGVPLDNVKITKALHDIAKLYAIERYGKGNESIPNQKEVISLIWQKVEKLELNLEDKKLIELQINFLNGKYGAAKKLLDELVDNKPNLELSNDVLYEKFRISKQIGNFNEALEALLELRNRVIDPIISKNVDFLFSQLYQQSDLNKLEVSEYYKAVGNLIQHEVRPENKIQLRVEDLIAVAIQTENLDAALLAAKALVDEKYVPKLGEKEIAYVKPAWEALYFALRNHEEDKRKEALLAIGDLYSQKIYDDLKVSTLTKQAEIFSILWKKIESMETVNPTKSLLSFRIKLAEKDIESAKDILEKLDSLPTLEALLAKVEWLQCKGEHDEALFQLAAFTKGKEKFHQYESKIKHLWKQSYDALGINLPYYDTSLESLYSIYKEEMNYEIIEFRTHLAKGNFDKAQGSFQSIMRNKDNSELTSLLLFEKAYWFYHQKQFNDAIDILALIKNNKDYELFQPKVNELYTEIYNKLTIEQINDSTTFHLAEFYDADIHNVELITMALMKVALQSKEPRNAAEAAKILAEKYPVDPKINPLEKIILQPLWDKFYQVISSLPVDEAAKQKAMLVLAERYSRINFLSADGKYDIASQANKVKLLWSSLATEDRKSFLGQIISERIKASEGKVTELNPELSLEAAKHEKLPGEYLLLQIEILIQNESFNTACDMLDELNNQEDSKEYKRAIRSLYQKIPAKYHPNQTLEELKLSLEENANYSKIIQTFLENPSHKELLKNSSFVKQFQKIYHEHVSNVAATFAKQSRELFAQIKQEDFMLARFELKKFPESTVHPPIQFFNKLSFYIVEDVLSYETIELRARSIEFWTNVATNAIAQYGDYFVAMAIYAAFEHSSIIRLKSSFGSCTEETRTKINQMRDISSTKGNSDAQRKIYANYDAGAFVPFVGIYNSQIIGLFEGNKKLFLGAKSAQQKLERVLSNEVGLGISSFLMVAQERVRNAGQLTNANPSLEKAFSSFQNMDDNELFNLSLLREPRLENGEAQPISGVIKKSQKIMRAEPEIIISKTEAVTQSQIKYLEALGKQYLEHELINLKKIFSDDYIDNQLLLSHQKKISAIIDNIKKRGGNLSSEIFSSLYQLETAIKRYQRISWPKRISEIHNILEYSELPESELPETERKNLEEELNRLQYEQRKLGNEPVEVYPKHAIAKFIHDKSDSLLGIDIEKRDLDENTKFLNLLELKLSSFEPKRHLNALKVYGSFDAVENILKNKGYRIFGITIAESDERVELLFQGKLKFFIDGRRTAIEEIRKNVNEHKKHLERLKSQLVNDYPVESIDYFANSAAKERLIEKRKELVKEISSRESEINSVETELTQAEDKVTKYEYVLRSYFIQRKNLKKVIEFAEQETIKLNETKYEKTDNPSDIAEMQSQSKALMTLLKRAQNLLESIPFNKNSITEDLYKDYDANEQLIKKSRNKLFYLINWINFLLNIELKNAISGSLELIKNKRLISSEKVEKARPRSVSLSNPSSSSMLGLFGRERSRSTIDLSVNNDLPVSFENNELRIVPVSDEVENDLEPLGNKSKNAIKTKASQFVQKVLHRETKYTSSDETAVELKPLMSSNESKLYSNRGRGNIHPIKFNVYEDGTREFSVEKGTTDYIDQKGTVEMMVKDSLNDPTIKKYHLDGSKEMVSKASIWFLAAWKANGGVGKGPEVYVKDKNGEWTQLTLRSMPLTKYPEIYHKARLIEGDATWKEKYEPENATQLSNPVLTPPMG